MDRLYELGNRARLGRQPYHASGLRPGSGYRIIFYRQGRHRAIEATAPHLSRRLITIHDGHVQVHDDKIGQEGPGQLDRDQAVSRLADDLDISPKLEQRPQALAHHRRVFSDQDSQAALHTSSGLVVSDLVEEIGYMLEIWVGLGVHRGDQVSREGTRSASMRLARKSRVLTVPSANPVASPISE